MPRSVKIALYSTAVSAAIASAAVGNIATAEPLAYAEPTHRSTSIFDVVRDQPTARLIAPQEAAASSS